VDLRGRVDAIGGSIDIWNAPISLKRKKKLCTNSKNFIDRKNQPGGSMKKKNDRAYVYEKIFNDLNRSGFTVKQALVNVTGYAKLDLERFARSMSKAELAVTKKWADPVSALKMAKKIIWDEKLEELTDERECIDSELYGCIDEIKETKAALKVHQREMKAIDSKIKAFKKTK